MTDIIVTDLDSTLAHTNHRAHLIPADRKIKSDWLAFSMACLDDEVIEGTATALRLLAAQYPIYIISGRMVDAYQNTLMWLDMHDIPFESLRLRRPDDPAKNIDYKVAQIRALKAEGLNPVLMFEDWPNVAAAIEAEGVPTLCVNPRYTDAPAKSFEDWAAARGDGAAEIEAAFASEVEEVFEKG